MKHELPSAILEVFRDSQVPLSLSDPNLPDDPLVLANDAFYRTTGYEPKEVLGRNCRFLQGKSNQPVARMEMRRSFESQSDAQVLFRNFRKNGEPFDNLCYTFHLFGDGGKLQYRVGSQFEIPMLQKAAALESHSQELAQTIDRLRANAAAPGGGMLKVSEIYGLAVKDLLQSRLSTLRAHRSF